MADKKISALTGATTPLAGTEVLPIVQSGATVKVANNDLRPKQIQSNATSGVLQVAGPASAATRVMTTPDANFTVARTDAAQSLTGDQTLATGNIIQGTAAKGINFTANTPAAGMTSQLLNWYEEGTWTPTYVPETNAFTSITYAINTGGSYTKIGRQVTVNGYIRTDAITVGAATGLIYIGGLPFVTSADAWRASGSIGYSADFTVNNPSGLVTVSSTTYFSPKYRLTANGAALGLAVTDLATTSATNFVFFTLSYQTT